MLPVPGNKTKEHRLETDGLAEVKFGSEVREKEFLLRPGVAFFNHGSYGTVPRRVLQMQEKYNREREEHPDFWYRLNAKPYMDQSRQDIAQFIGADVDSVFLVPNATTAINSVVRSFPFSAGDALLHCSYTYGAITNLCEDFGNRIRPDVQSVKMCLSFPPKSEEEVIQKYEGILKEYSNIKLAIIDHITSPSSVVLPVKQLVDLCHSRGVKVIIDGAHSLGQLSLNMKELGADVFTSNAHKWLYTPRGCAVLYLSEESRVWAHPPNTSWQIGQGLDLQFFDQGTRDHVPFICARHGLEFYKAIGGMDKVVTYTGMLADKAVAILEKELGLKPAPLPKSMEAPNLRLLELPPLKDFPSTADLWRLHREMFGNSPVFGLVVPIENKFYLRISTQVYTSEEDVTMLVQVVRDFLKNAV